MSRPICAVGGERIIDIGNGDDACLHRDRLTAESMGISAAIEALMVMPNDRDIVEERWQLADEFMATPWMLLDSSSFGTGIPAWLVERRIRYSQLAHIVQERAAAEHPQPRRRQPRRATDLNCERGDAVTVTACVDVLGFDSRNRRCNCFRVATLHPRDEIAQENTTGRTAAGAGCAETGRRSWPPAERSQSEGSSAATD